ncbi:heterokaryon incompatibility protein-domain-containing protein [Apiospora arundinis]
MRLLKTDQYKLVEANDIHTLPQYAILSHTWISPKDEITYQDFKQRKSDIENDIFKQKGWAKLRKYCDRAARDGWEWAWMDTCCIDKTNPADTQEAINAMFRWYQRAGICYAYLDDVDINSDTSYPVPEGCDLDDIAGHDNVADPRSDSHKALRESLINSKWFTRGWTLQELLAPPYLVFVDRAWRRIGTRESWSDEIREASRIEARHLTHFIPTDFSSCSIAMRFSWASGRHTTVEEDETYSLLGLFGISLPLIYGEGRWRAFNRLQRELITVYNDDSIFAWKLKPSSNELSSGEQQQVHEHGRGILAPSIREYWDSSSVEAYGSYANSFSMTNKGLEINAKRWRRADNPFKSFIRLNCGPGASKLLAIPLERVHDTYDRTKLDEIYDMTMIRLEEWVEESNKGLTVIRASNYSNPIMTSSIFALECPEQIEITRKYFVDFGASNGNQLKLIDESGARQDILEHELILEPNRLVFINIALRSEGSGSSQFDVVINLSEQGFPSVGVLSRGKPPWRRLGDPQGQASGMYVRLAHRLHYQVTDEPAYPVTAVDENRDDVVSVHLLPRPRQRRGLEEATDIQTSSTSREYSLKIRVQQGSYHDRPIPEHSNKRGHDQPVTDDPSKRRRY